MCDSDCGVTPLASGVDGCGGCDGFVVAGALPAPRECLFLQVAPQNRACGFFASKGFPHTSHWRVTVNLLRGVT